MKSELGDPDDMDSLEYSYFFAAFKGRVDMVEMMLGKDDAHQTSFGGMTGLMFAAKGGHVEVARLLLDRKADINYHKINPRNSKRDRTALHEAALGGHMEVAKFLLKKGAKLDPGALFQPLHAAAEGGHVEMVKFLLKQGANVDEVGLGSETALHQAAHEGHTEVVRELVKAKANVYATTTYHSLTTIWEKTVLDIAKESHPYLLPILKESKYN